MERAFDSYLPFDEKFLVTGALPENSTSIIVQYKAGDDSCHCDHKTECEGWTRVGWKVSSFIESKSFAIWIDPLEPNKDYRFCFTFGGKLTPSELASFRETANGAIERRLRRFPDGGFSDPELLAIQEELAARLPQRPGATPRLDGTVLDTRTPGALGAVAEFSKIMDSNEDRAATLQELTGFIDGATADLLALAGDPALEAVPSKRHEMRVRESTFFTAQLSTATHLLTLDDDLAHAVAGGVIPLSKAGSGVPLSASSLDSVWNSGVVEARLANLNETMRSLANLRAFVQFELPKSSSRQAANLTFETQNLEDVHEKMGTLVADLRAREKSVSGITHSIAVAVADSVSIWGSSGGSFVTRAKWHLSEELGLVYVPTFDQVVPYIGFNFYPRAVNKKVPLRLKDFIKEFWRRFAISVGFTVDSVEKSGERDDLFGSHAILVGAGLRIFDWNRVSAGGLFFTELDPNPLVDDRSPAAVFYVSTSIDFELENVLKKVFGIFK